MDTAAKSRLVSLKTPYRLKPKTPGINLNSVAQFKLLEKLSRHQKQLPNYTSTNESLRYQFNNDQFGESDGTFLFLMLCEFRPKNIIEIGSGWSSALMLDYNELLPHTATNLTFIEPYPERLYKTLKQGDRKRAKIITKNVQTLTPSFFESLEENDILFIDSSHVCKTGSDVNYLYFNILPVLKRGVIVHIHDIFFPFEYPREWVIDEKRNWNEIYLLRALLTGSDMFDIILWPTHLLSFDEGGSKKLVHGIAAEGGSIYLRKK